MLVRLLYELYRMTRRPFERLRRRVTPVGAFVFAGLFLALTASNPGQTMGLQVFLVLASMFAVALILLPFFRVRFAVERRAPRFVTAGESFSLRVRVHNRTRRLQRGLEYLENVVERPVSLPEFEARLRPQRGQRSFRLGGPLPSVRTSRARMVPLNDLPPEGCVETRVDMVAHRRGPLILAGGILARSDPFGLLRALRQVRAPQTLLVLPRRYPLPPLTLPGQSHYQRGGVALAAGVGESEEFVALREYRRGDSLRRVHWRSAARLGELVVKEFQDEYFVRHALVLDTFCEPSQDVRFEEAVAVAASFASTVPDQESLLDLMFVGPQTVCVTSGRGVGHSQQMLEVLAAVTPCRESRMAELESMVLRHRVALSGCLLVFLEWDEPRRAMVRRLRALQLPTLVLLIVPRGEVDAVPAVPPEDLPDRLVILESGRVGQDLQQLGTES